MLAMPIYRARWRPFVLAGYDRQLAVAFRPVYSSLPPGALHESGTRAVAALADCRLCPRDCGVNRLAGAWSACKTGRYAVVSTAFRHFGEEDCLRGWNGSGTIFFGHCNLRCVSSGPCTRRSARSCSARTVWHGVVC